jgi:hypothetical protein
MNWAEQTEARLGDLERTLANDPRWHAGLRRLGRIMTLRGHLAGRRGTLAATGLALATSAALFLVGRWLVTPSAASITALLAGCLIAGAIAFAAANALLDPHAVPPVREHGPIG